MPALAAAGFHVVAPDLRGYGRTTGWENSYDTDLRPFRTLNMARDVLGREPRHLQQCPVGEQDDPLLVHQDHAVGKRVQEDRDIGGHGQRCAPRLSGRFTDPS